MRDQRLPGLHITDHQMRLYMSYRQNHGPAVAAAKAGFSTATGYRIDRDQAETSVLFELIAGRHERRSMLITANQPFGE